MASKPRVSIRPSKAAKGDTVEVKSLVNHPMETGLRKDKDGNVIPRLIINKYIVEFNGKEVFSVDLDTAVSSPVYFGFPFTAQESGTFTFTWIDDNNAKMTATGKLEVT